MVDLGERGDMHHPMQTPPHTPTCMQVADLKEGIAHFYDESSALWEDMWGEHMHHGEGRGNCCRMQPCSVGRRASPVFLHPL
jgi:hypothetical protein